MRHHVIEWFFLYVHTYIVHVTAETERSPFIISDHRNWTRRESREGSEWQMPPFPETESDLSQRRTGVVVVADECGGGGGGILKKLWMGYL